MKRLCFSFLPLLLLFNSVSAYACLTEGEIASLIEIKRGESSGNNLVEIKFNFCLQADKVDCQDVKRAFDVLKRHLKDRPLVLPLSVRPQMPFPFNFFYKAKQMVITKFSLDEKTSYFDFDVAQLRETLNLLLTFDFHGCKKINEHALKVICEEIKSPEPFVKLFLNLGGTSVTHLQDIMGLVDCIQGIDLRWTKKLKKGEIERFWAKLAYAHPHKIDVVNFSNTGSFDGRFFLEKVKETANHYESNLFPLKLSHDSWVDSNFIRCLLATKQSISRNNKINDDVLLHSCYSYNGLVQFGQSYNFSYTKIGAFDVLKIIERMYLLFKNEYAGYLLRYNSSTDPLVFCGSCHQVGSTIELFGVPCNADFFVRLLTVLRKYEGWRSAYFDLYKKNFYPPLTLIMLRSDCQVETEMLHFYQNELKTRGINLLVKNLDQKIEEDLSLEAIILHMPQANSFDCKM